MLTKLAYLFGAALIAAGLLGFVPQLVPGGKLLGLFSVNDMHNYFHLASGAVAVLCGLAGAYYSKLFFQIFGLIYAIIALAGFFVYGDSPILGMIANNTADNWLHTVIALVSLYIGFLWNE